MTASSNHNLPSSPDLASHLPELLQAAVESTGEAVVVTDLAGLIVFANPAFERITGWSRSEVIGRNPRILKSGLESQSLYEELWQTILAGRTWFGSITNRRKDGTTYRAEQTIAPVLAPVTQRRIGYVSVHEDVSAREELEQRLHEATVERLELLQKEADSARAVQQHLYPSAPPQLAGFDIAGRTVTASELGGDYFDFIPLPDGRLALAVGDVCGHGIGPALVMTATRAWLRSTLQAGLPLNEALSRINDVLLADLNRGMFVTLFVSLIEPDSRTVISAGAGHVAHLVRVNGHVETLPSTGLLLGMSDAQRYSPLTEHVFSPGDILLLTTDGLSESESPERQQFGHEQTVATVQSAMADGKNASEIVDALLVAAQAFSHRTHPADDITIVVARCAN